VEHHLGEFMLFSVIVSALDKKESSPCFKSLGLNTDDDIQNVEIKSLDDLMSLVFKMGEVSLQNYTITI